MPEDFTPTPAPTGTPSSAPSPAPEPAFQPWLSRNGSGGAAAGIGTDASQYASPEQYAQVRDANGDIVLRRRAPDGSVIDGPASSQGDNKGAAMSGDATPEQIRDALTFKAAMDSRRLAAPQSPEGYKTELPAEFVIPEGTDFKFNENDPLLYQAKAVMHDIDQGRLSGQEAFSRLLGIYAGTQLEHQQTIQTVRNAELAKLGPSAPARMDAIATFLTGHLGREDGMRLHSRIFQAADVAAFEKLMSKFTSQGVAPFSQAGRVPDAPGKVSEEEYNRMTYSQKMAYARQFQQPSDGPRSRR